MNNQAEQKLNTNNVNPIVKPKIVAPSNDNKTKKKGAFPDFELVYFYMKNKVQEVAKFGALWTNADQPGAKPGLVLDLSKVPPELLGQRFRITLCKYEPYSPASTK